MKAGGLRENTRIRGNDIVLSGKNEADNPTIDRFTPVGQPEGITLTGPYEELGFTPYIQAPGFDRMTRQGFSETSAGQWDQNYPLINGAPLPDQNTQSRIPPYSQPPTLEIIPDTRVGFTQGWHGVTYAWAIQARTGGSLLISDIAPLTVLFVTQNQGIRINLDIDVSESIPFIVFGITPPYATELEAANSSEVYYQHHVSTRPRVPAVVDIWGNYKRDRKLSFLSTGNETFIRSIPGRPTTREVGSSKPPWYPQLAYSWRTPFGRSLSSHVSIRAFGQQRITWYPSSAPLQATAWIPEYVDSEGNWRSGIDRRIGERVSLVTNDPLNLPAHAKIEIDRNETDDTSGVAGPDSPLSNVTSIGKTLPTPGINYVRITRTGIDSEKQDQDESAPSPQASIDVPVGYFLRVRPPSSFGNFFPNAEATIIDPLTEKPEGWEHPASTGVLYTTPAIGMQRVQDVSALTASQDVFITPKANVTQLQTSVIVIRVDIQGYTSGRVDVVVRQTNNDNTTNEFTVQQLWGNQSRRVGIRLAATGGNAVQGSNPWGLVQLNNDVKQVQAIVRHIGSSAQGIRLLTTTVSNLGMHLGKTHPYKRDSVDPVSLEPSDRRYASLAVETPSSSYPGSGYAVVVINPPNDLRPVASGGGYIPGNFVEYFGSSGQPAISAFFMRDLRFGTRGEEQRTISIYMWWEGVVSPATPLRLLLKNSDNQVVADLGGFVTSVTGDSRNYIGADANGWVRAKLTFVAPMNAVIAELSSSAVGDGLFRVMASQYEFGAQATDFDISYAQTGSLVNTFEFGIPGVGKDELPSLNHITRIASLGADVSHETVNGVAVTSHSTIARTKHADENIYSDWTDNPDRLVIPRNGNGSIQIGTILTTSDLAYTPILHDHYVDFERVPDGSHGGRTVGSFLRGDGTEFDGTATAFNVPILDKEKPIVQEEFADGTQGFGVMGAEQQWLRGFGVEFYVQSAAEEAVSLLGEGLEYDEDQEEDASAFQIWIQGRKYKVRITSMDINVERSAYTPIKGLEDMGRWLFIADGLEGEVLEVDAI